MKSIICLLSLLLCGMSFAEDVQMHITDETTYLDVGRAYMEGSSLRGEGEFRLLVGSKSVPPFPMYFDITCPVGTTIVMRMRRGGLVECRYCLTPEQMKRNLPEYAYVGSYSDVAIIKYIKDMAKRYSYGKVVEIVIYPDNFYEKITQKLFLFYQLATLFPDAKTYVHIEEKPNCKDD